MIQLVWIILKQKRDDLDVCKLKLLSLDLKKLSDVIDNEVAQNRKFNTREAKEKNLGKKIPHATILIYINKYHPNK